MNAARLALHHVTCSPGMGCVGTFCADLNLISALEEDIGKYNGGRLNLVPAEHSQERYRGVH